MVRYSGRLANLVLGYDENYVSDPGEELSLRVDDVPEIPGLSSRDIFAAWRKEFDEGKN